MVGVVGGGATATGTDVVADDTAVVHPVAEAGVLKAEAQVNVFAAVTIAFVETTGAEEGLTADEPAGGGGGVIKTALSIRRSAAIFEVVVTHANEIKDNSGMINEAGGGVELDVADDADTLDGG